MTALLEGNPFAAKLGAEELEEKLNEETERLQALEPQEVAEPSEVWEKLEEELKKALETAEVETGEHVWENASVGEISERIAHFLEKGLVGKALGLLGDAQKKMPEEKMFKLTNTEDEVHEEEEQEKDNDDDEQEDGNDVTTKRLDLFRNIFIESKKTPEPSLSQSQHNNLDELTKQKLMVQYLKDSLNFSKIIHKSLPVVAQLLGSKQSTDILEGIDFFVSAFEFGVLNSMIGVRRMLALIWSSEPTIKAAVVSAYKRLYIAVDNNSARTAAAAVSHCYSNSLV